MIDYQSFSKKEAASIFSLASHRYSFILPCVQSFPCFWWNIPGCLGLSWGTQPTPAAAPWLGWLWPLLDTNWCPITPLHQDRGRRNKAWEKPSWVKDKDSWINKACERWQRAMAVATTAAILLLVLQCNPPWASEKILAWESPLHCWKLLSSCTLSPGTKAWETLEASPRA